MLFQPVLKRPPVVDNPLFTMQANGQSLSGGCFPHTNKGPFYYVLANAERNFFYLIDQANSLAWLVSVNRALKIPSNFSPRRAL